jgi:hypothetical protein
METYEESKRRLHDLAWQWAAWADRNLGRVGLAALWPPARDAYLAWDRAEAGAKKAQAWEALADALPNQILWHESEPIWADMRGAGAHVFLSREAAEAALRRNEALLEWRPDEKRWVPLRMEEWGCVWAAEKE